MMSQHLTERIYSFGCFPQKTPVVILTKPVLVSLNLVPEYVIQKQTLCHERMLVSRLDLLKKTVKHLSGCRFLLINPCPAE